MLRPSDLKSPRNKRPTIFVSACLLGHKVRYDGSDKNFSWIVDVLSKHVDLVPVCPEVEIGLGVPRPTIHMVEENKQFYLRSTDGQFDYTKPMDELSQRYANGPLSDGDGFIFKTKSPSCGIDRVKIYNPQGQAKMGKTQGRFAFNVISAHPYLPFIDEGRLHNQKLRETFLWKIYLRHSFRTLANDLRGLQDFHARAKYLIMGMAPGQVKYLGQLASMPKEKGLSTIRDVYFKTLFHHARHGTQIRYLYNSYQHIAGYFKDNLDKKEKSLINLYLEEFRLKRIHTLAINRLFLELAHKHQQPYIAKQLLLGLLPNPLLENSAEDLS